MLSSSSSASKVLLVDAFSLIYRAHFALRSKIVGKSAKEVVLIGFANALMEAIQTLSPTHIVIAFDVATPTLRVEEYNDYKAHRDQQPEAIDEALPSILQLLETLNITYLMQPGYEADDIIGTLARIIEGKNWKGYMMTSDKDFAQLVSSPYIYWYKLGRLGQKATLWDADAVCSHWSIAHPKQLIDLLGLWGDSADNIPGVPGIGKKKAAQLLQKFSSIEQLLANRKMLPAVMATLLEQYEQQALLSKQLATIEREVPLDLQWIKATWELPTSEQAFASLQSLGLYALAKRLWKTSKIVEQKEKIKPLNYDLYDLPLMQNMRGKVFNTPLAVTSLKEVQQLVEKFQKESAKVLSIWMPLPPRKAAHYLPLAQPPFLEIAFGKRVYTILLSKHVDENKEALSPLAMLLNQESISKVGYDLKAILAQLESMGLFLRGKLFDLSIAHHFLAPQPAVRWEDFIVHWSPPKDKKATCQQLLLYPKLKALLKEKKMLSLFESIEMPLLVVLYKMEKQGVYLDQQQLKAIAHPLQEKMKAHAQKIYHLSGDTTININSPKQLGRLLFEKLSLVKDPVKTSSGQFSTSELVLRPLSRKHPIVAEILAHRSLRKLQTTYLKALPRYIAPTDQRIHTHYEQAVVSSGRLSSSRPNLQNIPIRTMEGEAIRSAFCPQNRGWCLLSADYNQIELRIMAHLSEDPTLMAAFQEGEDVHKATAAHIFDVQQEAVTALQRREAKVVNFGIMYGMSAFGLSQTLECSRSKAKSLIEAYFARFPKVKSYIEQQLEDARSSGYIMTLLGRRKALPTLHAPNRAVRAMAERFAINMPIQGSAAELIKKAMVDFDRWLQQNEKLKVTMILQIHDELLIELPKEELVAVTKGLQHAMEEVYVLKVPLQVSMGSGISWKEAH